MRSTVVAVALGLALASCESDQRGARVEIVDSAGVEIVTNYLPAPSERATWTVSTEPTVSIGRVEGEPSYLLGEVRTAGWLPDGRIFAADETAHAVRVYSATGVHDSDVGRAGEGPGEFGWIWTAEPYRSDSLYVYDYQRQEVSIFDAELRFVRRLRHSIVGNYWVRAALPDGRLLAFSPGRGRLPGAPGVRPDSSHIIAVSPDGSRSDTLGAFRVALRLIGPDGLMQPFFLEPNASIVAAHGRIVWTEGDTFQYTEATSDGRILRIVRLPTSPTPVTDQTVADFKRTYLEFLGREGVEGGVERMVQRLEDAEYHHTLPETSTVLVDELGHVWVGRYEFAGTPAYRWEVFNPGGIWLASAQTPPGLHVQAIREDALLGLFEDALGVSYVRVHRVMKN